jgi:hypothetical protein
MNTLPQAVAGDIFDLRYRVSDIAIEHLADELVKFGCIVSSTVNYDSAVVIYFSRADDDTHPYLDGELRIDRIEQHFAICVRYGDETILPAFGGWSLVEEYLNKLLEG